MDRFKNILVSASPGHLDARTVRAAVDLADTNRARLTVVDVVAPLPRLHRAVLGAGRVAEVESGLAALRRETLRHLVDTTRTAVGIELTVLDGEPFIEVIRHVLAHGNDLVIVGGDEAEPGVTPELSSGVMHLLRKCPVPVWVMRPPSSPTPRILALVDPDPGDPVRDSLNARVLELAISMARRDAAELHVGHAWELVGEAKFRSASYVGLSDDEVDQMVATVAAAHREQLQMLLEPYGVDDLGAEVHVVAGEAGAVLPALAGRIHATVVVMGTVSRTGIAGLIIGNTAETILRSVRCSVLAVKPEGFVSPVRLD